MMTTKLFALFLFTLFYLPTQAAGLNTLSVSSAFADKSFSSLISLQPSLTDIIPSTDIDFSLDAGKFRNQVNYNSAVEDFTIEKTLFSAGIDLSWNRILTFGLLGTTENVNQNEVRVNGITSKVRIRLTNFAIKAALNDRYIRQVTDYVVLNTNLKDRLTLRSTKKTASLSYYGFEPFSFSLSYSKYTYDTDPTQANLLLSAQALLQNHGASFLSQIYSLIDHETTLDMVYNVSDKFDIELMYGETIDYLDPQIKSTEYRLGGTYYFKILSLAVGITGVTSEDTAETLFSGDLTLSYEF